MKVCLNADGDPQWWTDIRQAISEEDTRHLLEAITKEADAPSQNDAVRPWPSVLNWHTTEIMIVDFHKAGHVSQKTSRLFLNMARHPLFDHKDIRSETIVHQLLKCRLTVSGDETGQTLGTRMNNAPLPNDPRNERQLELPFVETAVHNKNPESYVGAIPPRQTTGPSPSHLKAPCQSISLLPSLTAVSLQRGKAARSTLQGAPLTALATTASHSAPSSCRPCQPFS